MGTGEGTERLAAALARLLGGAGRVERLRRVSGGASRETWLFDLVGDGGVRPLVLQRDRPGADDAGDGGDGGASMAQQAALLRAAHAAGAPVPRVVAAAGEDGDGAAAAADLGGPAIVLEHVDGETIPRRILRDDAYAGARARLARDCATALARVHCIPPGVVAGLDDADPLERWRGRLDELGETRAAFELAFRWLALHRPPPSPPALVHGDFRMGNLIVGPDGLRAVIDWELAHVGDPVEDLGWMCVKSWRFRAPLPVGGFAPYEALLDAYAEASGRRVDRATLRWWETFGTLRWGIICILQARAHLDGRERSVELAAIGRRVSEVEHDLLLLVP